MHKDFNSAYLPISSSTPVITALAPPPQVSSVASTQNSKATLTKAFNRLSLNASTTVEADFEGWTVPGESSITELFPRIEDSPRIGKEYRSFISEISKSITTLNDQVNLYKEKKTKYIPDHFFELLKNVSANIDLYKKGELNKRNALTDLFFKVISSI